MFVDESKQVVQRSTARVAEDKELAGERARLALVRTAAATTPVKLTEIVLHQVLDELGVNFFMSTYVSDGISPSKLTAHHSC